MPQIYRHSGPGEHSLAGALLVFDADGLATSEDPDVLALVGQFPEAFTLLEVAPRAPMAPVAPLRTARAAAEALEGLTVTALRTRAATAGIPRVSSLTKAALIAALVAEQGAE